MNLKKKDLKSYFLISILIILILVSNLPDFNEFTPLNSSNDEIPLNKDNEKYPNTSDFNVSSYIIGDGVNQSVRVYMTNASSSQNNEKYFDIPAPTDNMNLSAGEFNFNFGNNYTTEHIIESNDAIYQSILKRPLNEFPLSQSNSNLTILNGNGDASKFKNIILPATPPASSYFNITSVNGLVNFTVLANFSGVPGITPLGSTFLRDNIIALILNFTYSMYVFSGVNKMVNVTVKIQDMITGKFNTIVSKTQVNSSIVPLKIDKSIINENLNYTSLSNTSLLLFTFDTTNTFTQYNVTLRNFKYKSIMLFELPISSNKHVALEFDLQGLNSTVNGFYAWIRTLNVSQATTTILNITLYKANATISRSNPNQLGTEGLMQPDLTSGFIYSIPLTIGSYKEDKPLYFQFNPDQTDDLTHFNYFIVIKSDNPNAIFRLVTIPSDNIFGDGVVEHQLKTFNATGDNLWKNARSPIYAPALQLDASSFKLNITRGYMPSDFKVNGVDTLKIQNLPIINSPISVPGKPVLQWGLGYWNYNFTNPIGITSNNFRVNLEWNNTNIKGFKFDVNYTVIAFRNENATTQYRARYNLPIQWIFNYTLNLNKFTDYKWNFTELWFVYLDYFNAQNLTLPNGTNVFSRTGGEQILVSNPAYDKVVVSTQIINVSKVEYSGNYSLYLTQENIITDATMHSYIKYNTTLWESRGFMFGDNISIGLDIILPSNINNGFAPLSGFANISFFYPNGTYIKNLTTSIGKISKDNKKLSYDFNNQTIFEVTKNIPIQGTYSMGYFWTNGSIIGCSKVNIFIDSYNFTFDDMFYDSAGNVNILKGITQKSFIPEFYYTLLIASVNETTKNPTANFYAINKSLSLNEGTFSYRTKFTNYEYKVFLKNFIQNETILNPNEDVQFKVIIQNLDKTFDINVKINIKLVAFINNEWIIDESTTSNQLLTNYNPGNLGDTKEFTINLKMPNINSDLTWKGKNAPIRQGGAKTLVTIFIENNSAGTYFSTDYSILINKTQDLFEGYIIALKQPAAAGRGFFQAFERDECLYLPALNNFVINVIDENYVSIYDMINFTKGLELGSIFNNILIDPDNVIDGTSFNITSTLTTEFGDPLDNKTVLCQYYNGNTWINITSGKTDTEGNTDLRVETSDPDINPSVSKLFRLFWAGDVSIMNKTQNFTVNILIQTNRLSLSSVDDYDEAYIYRNSISSITLDIENSGTSNLRIIDIRVESDEDIDYKIKAEDNNVLENFKTDESTTIIIELKPGMITSSEIELRVIITAQNILSGEIISSSERFEFGVIDKPLYYYIFESFIFIMLALFALIFFTSYLYYKKLKGKIEAPIQKAELERPKKPRYVKISELKAEEMKKEVITPSEETKVEEKKQIELDDLLKEKLEKEKKESTKSEEVSEKIEVPSKKVKKLSKKGRKEVKKPTEGRISTRQMVEKKKMEKKGFLKKLKKKKKETPKQKIKEKIPPAKKGEEKKKTDLDSLLEEEGLKDK